MGGWPQKCNLKIDDDMAIEIKTQRPIPKSSRIKSTTMSAIPESVLSLVNGTIEEDGKNSTKKEITEVTTQLNTSKSSKMNETTEQETKIATKKNGTVDAQAVIAIVCVSSAFVLGLVQLWAFFDQRRQRSKKKQAIQDYHNKEDQDPELPNYFMATFREPYIINKAKL